MSQCESCSHFQRNDSTRPAGVEQSDARYWGTCTRIIDTNGARRKPHSDRAYPQDASGYRAWLMVRQDFGCIEHT